MWKDARSPCDHVNRPQKPGSGQGFATNHVLQVDEGVIDGHNLHLLGGEGSAGHQTADAAEPEKNKFLRLACRWRCTPPQKKNKNSQPIPQSRLRVTRETVQVRLKRKRKWFDMYFQWGLVPAYLLLGNLKPSPNKGQSSGAGADGGVYSSAHTNTLTPLRGLKSRSSTGVVILAAFRQQSYFLTAGSKLPTRFSARRDEKQVR